MLEGYKKILSYFGFKVDFKMNGMDEEYIECDKESELGVTKIIIFENMFTTIIHNGQICSFVSANPQMFVYKLMLVL